MSVEQMRAYLKEQYGDSWAKKVDKMSDKQVLAIYYRMLNSKK